MCVCKIYKRNIRKLKFVSKTWKMQIQENTKTKSLFLFNLTTDYLLKLHETIEKHGIMKNECMKSITLKMLLNIIRPF